VYSFQGLVNFEGNADSHGLCNVAHGEYVHAPLPARYGCIFTSPVVCPMLSAMFGKPRQLDTEAQVYDAAIKILMRRAHSVHEMKKALARRCEDDKIVRGVVERLKRENLLDDARYAKQFTRLRAESRKQGEFRIARDLRARGIPDRHIETAIKDAAAGTDPAAIIRQRIERKLRLYRGEIDERKLASLYRSLIGAGFPSDLIRKELHRITHEEIPEVEPSDESA
jgi:regulatory protein